MGLPHGSVVSPSRRPNDVALTRKAVRALPATLVRVPPSAAALRFFAMTPRHLLVENLARALISGPATMHAARARCAEVLGESPPWVNALLSRVLRRFASAWHAHSTQAMMREIAESPELRLAFVSRNAPKLHSLSLTSPGMAPTRIALGAVALPILPTAGDIADWLNIQTDELQWFANAWPGSRAAQPDRCDHYHHQWKKKRSGGLRLIEIPKSRLRALQRRLLHELLDYVPLHECAHGFRSRHSILTHARLHTGKTVVIKLDLQDFFLTITANRVRGFFMALGYPEPAARILSGLCVHAVPRHVLQSCARPSRETGELPSLVWHDMKRYKDPHLPQGAPTSPALANLCAFKLDVRLHGLAQSLGATYSRYADDLTFSGDARLARVAARIVVQVGAIALEEGFVLNHRKTRVMRSGTRQMVTGVVVNEKPNLSRRDYDVLKATLHNCARAGASTQNRSGEENFRAHVAGRVSYASFLNSARGERLRRAFESIRWD